MSTETIISCEYGVAFWDLSGVACVLGEWHPEIRVAEAWLDTEQAEHPNVEHFIVERIVRRRITGTNT